MKHAGVAEYEALFLQPRRWQFVGAGEGDVPAVDRDMPPARRRWSREHTHRHPAREMLFCIRGEGCFGLGEKLYPCRPGLFFVIDPDVGHDDHYPGDASGLEHLWIRPFGDQILLNWLRVEGGAIRPVHDAVRVIDAARVGADLVRGLEPDADGDAPGAAYRAMRFRLFLGALGLVLLPALRAEAPVGRPEDGGVQERVIRAIQQHIEATAGKDVTLDFLAHFAGYSKYHLHRLFRAHTGRTIHQYVDACRRDRVRQLRAEGSTNAAIADALGFSGTAAYLRWRRTAGPSAAETACHDGESG